MHAGVRDALVRLHISSTYTCRESPAGLHVMGSGGLVVNKSTWHGTHILLGERCNKTLYYVLSSQHSTLCIWQMHAT